MPSKYETPGLRNPEGWTLGKTDWHKKWLANFPDDLHGLSVTVLENNRADEWLDSIRDRWEGKVFYPHLAEVRKGIAMPSHVTAPADVTLSNRHLLLTDRELSKIEILQRECLFRNPIWIVDYSAYADELYECSKMGTVVHKHSLSIEAYISRYIKQLENNEDFKCKIELRNHIQQLLNGTSKFNKLFLETDWSDCLEFPAWEDYVRRFKYTASPLILDVGHALYHRKYTLLSFSPDGYPICRPYLKRISHGTLLNWLNQ